ncbi:hypothetical protein Rhopal_002195-T1 [Rhodotorula paludigena]|uniref:Enoyl reductase (ER) domain-containing protein n=1 Tax=Rhodotorula paludigena TaxID=86838 RepID=A0AAV5GIB4_9BASI|nr:hypothetical protein Rhopal_002195-T1 [Rhodotorula paludigena]
MSMRAVLIKDGKSETADGLYVGETDRPTLKPGDGRILVKVICFGLNRMDIMQRKGGYPLPPGASSILGVEFSGTVEEPGESEYKKGDEVFGLATGGAYAEYISVPAGMTTRKPEHLSWEKAAAMPENLLTAWQTLMLIAEMKEGQSVLVHAGASGVGLAAIQLAKLFGAELVVATAGSDDKVNFVEQHGAKGINYKTQNFADEVSKLTNGEGVNVIIDLVGASYWESNVASLARDGRIVLVGLVGGAVTDKPFNLAQLLYKRARVEGTTLRSRSLEYQTELLQDFRRRAMDKVFAKCKGEEGIDLAIHKVFDWKDIVQAHQEMEEAKNIGKIIVRIS